MADAYANFAYGVVLTPPMPATTGTSLTLNAGQGAQFPVVPFNATVWPIRSVPTYPNAEIVRVTARAGDTLTLVRQQEATQARAIIAGDQIAATLTKKMIDELVAPAAFYDFPETQAATNPGADILRLYGIDFNGVTFLEQRDSLGRTLRLGRDTIAVGKIQESGGIAKGQAVYIYSATANVRVIKLALADSRETTPALGVAMETGANQTFIRVMTVGVLSNLDTSAFAEGDRVFLSATTPGALTSTYPVAPMLIQRMGVCLRQHASLGDLAVSPATAVSEAAWLATHAAMHQAGGRDPITALDASVVTTGTLPDARLSTNVPLLTTGDLKIARDVYEKGRTTPVGHWIAPAFTAANFSADPPGVWTVASGHVFRYAYALIGKTMIMAVIQSGGVVSGTPPAAAALRIAIPGGFLPAGSGIVAGTGSNGGSATMQQAQVVAGRAYITLQAVPAPPWINGPVDNFFTIMFEVQ
jgi:hypothetical protein